MVGGAGQLQAASSQSWDAERAAAVAQAREGQPSAALPPLERLHAEHPDDLNLTHDLIVVYAWADREADSVQLYAALPAGPEPDYVLEPVGLAYRHLGQPAQALALFRQGQAQSPANPRFVAGEIRSLVDLTEIVPAIDRAEADLHSHGDRVDVLLAAGFAEIAHKQPVEALRYIDRAVKLDPAAREPRHDRILAIDEMGAPQVSIQLADENPGLLTPAERRRVEGDAAAALVRWGVVEEPNETFRFAATDRAIAALDALIVRWTLEGEAARGDILRARFDRMVAYRDRARMADVLTEYEDLRAHDVALPIWAEEAAADAKLYFRQPEAARDLYQSVLRVAPRNADARLGLFYAYVDLDDYGQAYPLVDAAVADQAVWLYLKGLNEPIDNPERATAELAAAQARLYGDELADANQRLAAMAEPAPNNTRYITPLANIYAARGWPRLATEEYQISRALKPKNVETEVGQARAELILRDYPAVDTHAADLTQRFPENLEVQRLDRLWDVHNMAEFRLDVEKTLHSATSVQGGPGLTVDALLYSPPIDYNWRLFGEEYGGHEQLTTGEGKVTLRTTGVGAEYRGGDLAASLEATINSYGPDLGDTAGSSLDKGRMGLRAEAAWSIDDYWEVTGGAELFARDIPLRALGHGITAKQATGEVIYRQSELREVSLTGTAMKFSDGNTRTSLAALYTERLWTDPYLTVDGLIGLAESHNSGDANRFYFNPHQDALATLALSITQPIYRRYEFIWDHHLVITPGAYWERGFGSGGVGSVLYEHRVRADDVFELGLGVTASRQPYDGVYENDLAFLLNLRVLF